MSTIPRPEVSRTLALGALAEPVVGWEGQAPRVVIVGSGLSGLYAVRLAEPVGRARFAGEHTAVAGSGMEGALDSGERAAREILARP